MTPPGQPCVSIKNFSPFGPAVWSARYINVLFHYIDDKSNHKTSVGRSVLIVNDFFTPTPLISILYMTKLVFI